MTDRNEPLRLMDEIERLPGNEGGVITLSRTDRQSLRAALEAQRDELASMERELDRAFDAINDMETVQCVKSLRDARDELAQAHARIARLEDCLDEYTTQVNADGNFTAWGALNERPRQSAAALKAEVLEEAARDIANDDEEGMDVQTWLEIRADRIRREAKEEGDE